MADPRSAQDKVVGYAVVGLGWISQAAMLPAFRNARKHARLVALVSGDAGKRRALAERYALDPKRDTYSYDDYEACLDRDDVDAAYIAVPNHLHREYTERTAARGVHVLCEKPMAVTAEDCGAMIDACAGAGVKLMIAYRLHFDPANLEAVARIEDGSIGRTRLFSATFTQQVEQGDIRLMPPEKGGGPLYDIGIYCINAARYLLRAEPEAVGAVRASRPQARFEEASEMISCMLRFPEDRLATFTCSFGAHAGSMVQLVGERGELRLDNAFSFRGERRLEQRGGRGDGRARTIPEYDQFGPQLVAFSRCIVDDREPEPSGEEGLVDVRIIRTLYHSLEDGGLVDVDVSRDRRPTPDMAVEYPAIEAPELVRADAPSD